MKSTPWNLRTGGTGGTVFLFPCWHWPFRWCSGPHQPMHQAALAVTRPQCRSGVSRLARHHAAGRRLRLCLGPSETGSGSFSASRPAAGPKNRARPARPETVLSGTLSLRRSRPPPCAKIHTAIQDFRETAAHPKTSIAIWVMGIRPQFAGRGARAAASGSQRGAGGQSPSAAGSAGPAATTGGLRASDGTARTACAPTCTRFTSR